MVSKAMGRTRSTSSGVGVRRRRGLAAFAGGGVGVRSAMLVHRKVSEIGQLSGVV
jgi:hypothetical protein